MISPSIPAIVAPRVRKVTVVHKLVLLLIGLVALFKIGNNRNNSVTPSSDLFPPVYDDIIVPPEPPQPSKENPFQTPVDFIQHGIDSIYDGISSINI